VRGGPDGSMVIQGPAQAPDEIDTVVKFTLSS
jgi:hypothetical protein